MTRRPVILARIAWRRWKRSRTQAQLFKVLVLLFDSAVAFYAMKAAVGWRFDFANTPIVNRIDEVAGLIALALCVLVWLLLGIPRAIWRYTSLDDIRRLTQGVVTIFLIVPLLMFLFVDRGVNFPRSSPLIAAGVMLLVMLVSRIALMILQNGDVRALLRRRNPDAPDAILVGTAASVSNYVRDMDRRSSAAAINIIGMVGTRHADEGRSIRGVPVLGHLDNVSDIFRRVAGTREETPIFVVTDPNLARQRSERLVRLASEFKTTVSRIRPGAPESLTAFEAGDLIGRRERALDITPVRRLIANKRVLITGAGGTIGSELTRQVMMHDPARVILVELSEYNLYEIDRGLHAAHPDLTDRWVPYLGNICDKARMEEIFGRERPDIVLHAAAYKHVPLSELNPLQTLRTNITGTAAVLDYCRRYDVSAFTLISTDKAVSPSNIMGASKRVAELLTLASQARDKTLSACSVRFGNVLGSTGSVIPLFDQQIAAGGPVTVTHPDVERYFMTVQEAAALVLQATALNTTQGGSHPVTYVLEMGAAVNIAKLARQLIRLRGLKPGEDIRIVYTGLRPGEKLREKLVYDAETLEPTYVKGVQRFIGDIDNLHVASKRIDRLMAAVANHDRAGVRKALAALLPGYVPNGTLDSPSVRAASAAE